MSAARRSASSVALGALLAATLVGSAAAQGILGGSIPDKEINRDLVRRTLLDTCVYAESAKEGAKQDKVADACQCASFKALKNVKNEEIAKISNDHAIPDEMYKATTEAFGSCMR